MEISDIAIQLLTGVSVGMVVFLIASGLTLVFGVLEVLNFAHGCFYMLSAYLCYTIVSALAGTPESFYLAVVVAPICVAFFGFLIEFSLLRRVYRLELLYQLLLTFALVYILGDVAKMIWGLEYLSTPTPEALAGSISLLGRDFPIYNLFLIVLAAMVGLGLWFMLHRTRFGRVIRGTAADREIVSTLGVNVPRIFSLVFLIGAWLAGLSGALMAPITAAAPGMDIAIILDCFIVIVIGGMGSMGGALLGALILGEVNALSVLFVPRLTMVFPFIIMAVILIVRPWGLLGKPIR
jgi:branched-chain amino acid transport system permease protein